MKCPQHNVQLYNDNEVCIIIALQEAIKHNKTKHIENKVHHIRDLIQKKHVDIVYINTQLQLADAFTKPLGKNLSSDVEMYCLDNHYRQK
jgi:hypothetical protein